jgi:Zn-dependent protease with chaperone function
MTADAWVGDRNRCPTCDSPLVGGGHHVAWCRRCDWNVEPHRTHLVSSSRGSPRRRARAARAATNLYRSLEGRDVTRAGWDTHRVMAYALAVAVHAGSLALVVGGAALVVVGLPSVFLTLTGLVPLAIGVLMRPRLGRLPSDAVVLDRDGAPETWRLIDDVSATAGVQPPKVLVVDTDVNAWTAVVGLRRRRVICLGMGLHALLTPQELAVVLAHEVAHARNGDLREGVVVGSAVRTLAAWGDALHDDGRVDQGEFLANAAEQMTALLMSVIGVIPRSIRAVLEGLQLRSGQRAEYLADQIAADVAGTDAVVSFLHAALLTEPARDAMRRAALRDEPDLWAAARTFRAGLPPTEAERRVRAGRARDHAVDDTHPPTMLRSDLVGSRAHRPPAVVVDAGRARAVERELSAVAGRLDARLRGELLEDGP